MAKFFRGSLVARMAGFTILFEKGLNREVKEVAQQAEEYMKQNAPWEDQTGDAREGLTAKVRVAKGQQIIDLFHTVDYGIWLEIRWNGRYAIINPTIEKFGPELMGGLSMGSILGGI